MRVMVYQRKFVPVALMISTPKLPLLRDPKILVNAAGGNRSSTIKRPRNIERYCGASGMSKIMSCKSLTTNLMKIENPHFMKIENLWEEYRFVNRYQSLPRQKNSWHSKSWGLTPVIWHTQFSKSIHKEGGGWEPSQKLWQIGSTWLIACHSWIKKLETCFGQPLKSSN